MAEEEGTWENVTWPWLFLSLLTVLGALEGLIVLATFESFPWTPKLVTFYLYATIVVIATSSYMAAARSLACPKQISISSWGVSGEVVLPRWTHRPTQYLSVPFATVRRVMRWLPGWLICAETSRQGKAARAYIPVSRANAVRVQRAWERWKVQGRDPTEVANLSSSDGNLDRLH